MERSEYNSAAKRLSKLSDYELNEKLKTWTTYSEFIFNDERNGKDYKELCNKKIKLIQTELDKRK